ncbi:MAG: hypothetical protein ACKOVA_15950 [Novosphingobium sp.]
MQLTIFGVLVIAIGLILLFSASRMAMMLFVLAVTLLGGSAAISLPALGGSTIPPAHLAIVFLVARALVPGKVGMADVGRSIEANFVLVFFVLYGVVGAMVLPRLFQNAILITPLRPNPTRDVFAVEALHFTNQNVTVAVYYMATLFAAFGGWILTRDSRAQAALPRAAAVIGLVHAVLGLLSVILKDPLAGFFGFFRNGFYAQLDQSVGDIARMNGIFAEPAIYAVYGFSWFVFLFELWLRRIEPRLTGLAAAVLGTALLLSTSSTAYIGLAGYGLILATRFLLIPGTVTSRQLMILLGTGLLMVTMALALAAALPDVGAKIASVIDKVTVGKIDTESAIQRAFWAKQGIAAFVTSNGLGIGPGSFRSSSLLTAILGSMGVLGSVAFVWHLGRVFMPLRKSTWITVADPRTAIGAAASWTSLIMLIPPSFSAASPDPGILWGAFTGLALGLRSLPDRNGPDARLSWQSASEQPALVGAGNVGNA